MYNEIYPLIMYYGQISKGAVLFQNDSTRNGETEKSGLIRFPSILRPFRKLEIDLNTVKNTR